MLPIGSWEMSVEIQFTKPFININSVIEMMTVLTSVHLKICRDFVGEKGKIHDILYLTLFNL